MSEVCWTQNVTFDYLNGRKEVEIPFDYQNNFIIIHATLNNVLPLNFIFDTGAQHSLIFKKLYTDLLGAQYDRVIPLVGSDMQRDLFALVTRNLKLDIPNVISFRKDLLVLEEDYFKLDEIAGFHIDGLLGGEAFRHYVVKINYRKRVIVLTRKDAFQKPRNRYTEIPIDIEDSKPFFKAKVTLLSGEEVDVKLLMDTGAGLPLLLYTNTHQMLKLPEKVITGKLGKGLGGFLEGYLGRVNELSVAGLQFPNLVSSFQEVDTAQILRLNPDEPRNGLIGNQVWSRFEVIIDYLENRLYLRPEKNWDEEFVYDRSGLIIFAVGHELKDYLVNTVLPNSPASEADIRKGDRIKRVNGIPSSFLTLSDISRYMQKKVGKRIKLTIIRDGVKMKKEFRLRDLL